MPNELLESERFEFDESNFPPIAEAVAAYCDARDAERDRLAAGSAESSEVVIPLSAGLWPATKFTSVAPTLPEWKQAKGLR